MSEGPQLTFVPGQGFELAQLGVVIVGTIYCGSGPVLWQVLLPQLSPRCRRADSSAAARDALRDAVGQWVDAAGLAPALPPAEPVIRSFRTGVPCR